MKFGQKKKVTIQNANSIPLAYAKFKIEFDPDGIPYDLMFVDLNEQFVEVVGSTLKDIIGKHLSETSPEYKKILPQRLKDFSPRIVSGAEINYEVFIESRNKWYDIFANVENDDTINLLLSDCSNRKKIEEDLKESEQKFKSLYENATIGLYRTSPEGEILMANNALIKLLGFNSFTELVSRNLEEDGFNPLYPRQKFKDLLNREGEIKNFESSWITKLGSEIYLRESAKNIKNEKGEVIYIPILEDMSGLSQGDFLVLLTPEIVRVENNISRGIFKVKLLHPGGMAQFELFDITGRRISEKEIEVNRGVNSVTLNFNLPDGIYFLRIKGRRNRLHKLILIR